MRTVDGTEALARVRELRRKATPAEEKLWSCVRDRRLEGFKFRFQLWVGPFIADFVCKQARLIVELDGSQHLDNQDDDEARSRWLKNHGYKVTRFWNNEVLNDTDAVLTAIRAELLSRVPSPSHPASRGGPLPLPSGEG